MKTLLYTFYILLFLSGILIAQQSYDDVVYLKNGSIIRGLIIEQIPNVSLKIQTKDNSVFFYSLEDKEKIIKEPIQEKPASQKNEYFVAKKNPTTAVLLSGLLPGAGQFYNDDVSKGVIMTSLYVAGWALYFAAGYSDQWVEDDYYWASYGYYYEEETPWLYIGLGMAVGTWVWSMIDAGVSASDYNNKLWKGKPRYGHMYENYLNEKLILGIDLGANMNGLAGGVTLHF